MKQDIIIISDLWGKGKSNWFSNFNEILSIQYNVTFLDACELGAVDPTNYNQDSIHCQFIDFGIENAVSKLLEIIETPTICIGCSVGGVIAWKAALQGLPVDRLLVISSTRLRYETSVPSCTTEVYFGELDRHIPSASWIDSIGCKVEIIGDYDHEMYKDPVVISGILKEFV